MIQPEWQTIYQLLTRYDQSTKRADIFFDADFRDFIEDREFENNLLIADFGFRCTGPAAVNRYSDIIMWFLRNGLRLDDA